ncbi:hypothetical protein H4R21_005020 [Coemansia helicoidea]|uniref:Uncharacterized protein n=2 Tax=Coemansia TaxID=4863 RepID=A0ACC1KUH4_9FUNG|nr:hypothetical protein H4R21_005020 [Coemansia helicoidea]
MELKPNIYNPYQVKHRRRTTKEQLALLEGTFKTTPKPSSEVRKSLAGRLSMTAREVQIWFQNRRAKQKNMLLRASAAAPSSSPPASAAPPSDLDAAASLVSALLPSPGKALRRDRPAAISSPPPLLAAAKEPLPLPAARRHSDAPLAFVHGGHLAGPALQPSLLPGLTALDAVVHSGPASLLAPAGQASTSRSAQQLKRKRADPDSDRFHTARVHHEAFDGTNKLPVKPDAFMTAEEQLSMLDPANLPNFAMPGTSAGIGPLALGTAFSPQPQPQSPFASAAPGMWPVAYGQMLQTVPPPPPPPPQQTSTIQPIYAGLLGVDSGPCSAPALGPFGLAAPCSGLESPAPHSAPIINDMQLGSDPTLAFYQTLLMLSHHASVPPQPQPLAVSRHDSLPGTGAAAHHQPCSQGALFMPSGAFAAMPAPRVGVAGMLGPDLLAVTATLQGAAGAPNITGHGAGAGAML